MQHPGERHGSRNGNAEEARRFQLQLSNGESLSQQRWVPLGSNWPSNRSGAVHHHVGGDRKTLFEDKVAISPVGQYRDDQKHEWLESTRNYLISKAFEMDACLRWAESAQATEITSHGYLTPGIAQTTSRSACPMTSGAISIYDCRGTKKLPSITSPKATASRRGADRWCQSPLGARPDSMTCTAPSTTLRQARSSGRSWATSRHGRTSF